MVDACERVGERLAGAARRRERVLFATGHPGDLDPLYGAIAELAAARGAEIVRPADEPWFDDHAGKEWTIAYHGAVGMVTDGERPRHTHWPEAMRRMLADERPDLVMADHGLAGAAISRGRDALDRRRERSRADRGQGARPDRDRGRPRRSRSAGELLAVLPGGGRALRSDSRCAPARIRFPTSTMLVVGRAIVVAGVGERLQSVGDALSRDFQRFGDVLE